VEDAGDRFIEVDMWPLGTGALDLVRRPP